MVPQTKNSSKNYILHYMEEIERTIKREYQAHKELSDGDKLKAMLKINRPALNNKDLDYVIETDYTTDDFLDEPIVRRRKRFERKSMIGDYNQLIEQSKTVELDRLKKPADKIPTKVEPIAETAPKQPTLAPKQPELTEPIDRNKIDWNKSTFKVIGDD